MIFSLLFVSLCLFCFLIAYSNSLSGSLSLRVVAAVVVASPAVGASLPRLVAAVPPLVSGPWPDVRENPFPSWCSLEVGD